MAKKSSNLNIEELFLYCIIHKETIFIRIRDEKKKWVVKPLSQVSFNKVLQFIDYCLINGRPSKIIAIVLEDEENEKTSTSGKTGKKTKE